MLCYVLLKFHLKSQYNIAFRKFEDVDFNRFGDVLSAYKNAIQHEKQLSALKEKFDFGLLQNKFKNESCPLRNLTLMDEKSTTALLSYPASGNSWTRHLIEQLSGISTCAPSNRKRGCIVFKMHRHTPEVLKRFDNAIIIIRNPLYSSKSFFHFKYGKQKDKPLSNRTAIERHKGYADPSLFFSSKWTNHVTKGLLKWRNSYIGWLNVFKRKGMILVYEHMQQNLVEDMTRIVRYLKIPVTPRDFWCAFVNQEGKKHRIPENKTVTKVSNIFTAKQKRTALKYVCEVSRVARDLGIDLDISQWTDLTETPNTTLCL
ncbi:sialate:O-sulfotransferase 1-like [Ylistrum balloti]|uniref:sialate:O-sulfotransferase 1-like n=1 Tax=Ylistrum balloti TaxID=509963 RepID=UPI002905B8A4|nr:sialate:O-sulfotransferase 1-like [Ylistrum balloti]XP_060081203.1 sialate:O-sulfotransferase 1-like [Ylistrum balloti]